MGDAPETEELLSPQPLLDEGIQELQNDRTNGAQMLATNAVVMLQSIIAASKFESMKTSAIWREIRIAANQLSISRPSMGSAITSALTQALRAIEYECISNFGKNWLQASRKIAVDHSNLKDVVINCLDEFLEKRSHTSQQLCEEFSQYLIREFSHLDRPLRILTLSSWCLKRSLLHAFVQIEGLQIELRILESRPRCEGASFGVQFIQTLALELENRDPVDSSRNPKLKVVVAPDSHVCRLAEGVDIVLLGSDRISERGDVSNKMGSLAAVLCAKQISSGVKVVALSASDKIAKPGGMDEHVVENNDIEEVIEGWDEETRKLYPDMPSETLVVENVYFEWVPARFVDVHVTEKGILDGEEIQDISREKKKLEKGIFDEEVMARAADRLRSSRYSL